MALIPSPRHTAADLAEWRRYEHWDDTLARSSQLDRMADKARALIEQFADAGPCYLSVSWGKDSVVVAHLLATSRAGERVPLVFARARHWETPEVDQVRDAFLTAYPHVRYEEIEYEFRVPLRGEPGFGADDTPTQDALRETLDQVHGGRRISGVRAEESAIRAKSLRWHGDATDRTCRPIIRWRCAEHVFPYLHKHDLPVHPIYAMTAGGHYDRRWLRVHALGCQHPDMSAVYSKDPEAWERLYYQDVITAAAEARKHMWTHA